MSIIKVSKKPEFMDENVFVKEAIKELQTILKRQGEELKFDLEEREKNNL